MEDARHIPRYYDIVLRELKFKWRGIRSSDSLHDLNRFNHLHHVEIHDALREKIGKVARVGHRVELALKSGLLSLLILDFGSYGSLFLVYLLSGDF